MLRNRATETRGRTKKPSFQEKTRFLFAFCTFFLYEPRALLKSIASFVVDRYLLLTVQPNLLSSVHRTELRKTQNIYTTRLTFERRLIRTVTMEIAMTIPKAQNRILIVPVASSPR